MTNINPLYVSALGAILPKDLRWIDSLEQTTEHHNPFFVFGYQFTTTLHYTTLHYTMVSHSQMSSHTRIHLQCLTSLAHPLRLP